MTSKPSYINDTIVAAATPAGVGGVAIIRVSGPEARRIAQSVAGNVPEPRMATLATLGDPQGETIDRGMMLWFPAPRSFTGEDVLEFHAHGGPVVVDALIDAAIESGARRAEPGEFSRRAFLNDKLDLIQAEAIADLIGSGTRQAARAALRSLSGDFSAAITALQSRMINLRMHVEAALDFPEEEIDFLSDAALLERIETCGAAFDQLQRQAKSGRVLRDGFQMVIIGRPNAGKSSLMNRLSGEETAIVTDIAGTTRDVLRETINIDGLAVELVDTAGLRDNPDSIEAEGIRRAREAIARADAIIWLRDASSNDNDSLHDLEPGIVSDMPIMVVRNKMDLVEDEEDIVGGAVAISATTGKGLDELRRQIRHLAGYHDHGEGAFTARRRHVNAITAARNHFDLGQRQLKENHAGEIFAEELRMAQEQLSEVTGEFSSDDLLGRIFSSFCIGK